MAPISKSNSDSPVCRTHFPKLSYLRVIALLSLILGFTAQMLLDGQTFSHAVFGIACGIAAIVCSLRSARADHPNRWEGRIMAGLGIALGVGCIVMLPSSYQTQKKFNDQRVKIQKLGRALELGAELRS